MLRNVYLPCNRVAVSRTRTQLLNLWHLAADNTAIMLSAVGPATDY